MDEEVDHNERMMVYNQIDALQRADYLSYHQFALAFDFSYETIAKWASVGKLPIKFMGSSPRIDMNAYRNFMEIQKLDNKWQEGIDNNHKAALAHSLIEESLNAST